MRRSRSSVPPSCHHNFQPRPSLTFESPRSLVQLLLPSPYDRSPPDPFLIELRFYLGNTELPRISLWDRIHWNPSNAKVKLNLWSSVVRASLFCHLKFLSSNPTLVGSPNHPELSPESAAYPFFLPVLGNSQMPNPGRAHSSRFWCP